MIDTTTFSDIFSGHPDFWGAVHGECMKEPPGAGHWQRHLDGKVSLGIYPLRADGTCRWGCIDEDSNDLKKATAAYEAVTSMGVNCGVYIERSKGKGFHVWLLLDGFVAARDVRRILRHAADKAGLAGVEIFPKQDKLDTETVHGNYVNLPYNGDNPDGRRMMLDPLTGTTIPYDDFLQDIRLFPASSLDLVLEELPADEGRNGSSEKSDNWLEEMLASTVPVGDRRPALTRLAGALRQKGIAEGVAVEIAKSWAGDHFEEPLTDEEIEKHIRGPYRRYGIRNSNGNAPDDLQPDEVEDVVREAGDAHARQDVEHAPLLDAGDGDLPRISRRAWEAVVAANDPPLLYQQAGVPARIETVEDVPVIRQLSLDKLRHRVARVADWYRDIPIKGGQQVKRQPAPPPMVVVRDMMADPSPPLPVLTRIVEAPVFGPDGDLQTEPGYHPSSRTFYTGGVEVKEGVTAVIYELLCDFPFVGEAEKAHAIALMLLPFVRDLINGPTPLHLIEKPSPGTGGTLLAEMLTFPSLGRTPAPMTEARDEDEWRKRITARLMAGPSVIFIDNLHRRLESAALSAAITGTYFEDRILGKSETISLPVRCAWVATGNNPALSNEIARRAVRIRLDAKLDRPSDRTGFRHPDIRRWAADHRGEIVGAVIAMVKRWLDEGRPRPDASLGGFESWSDVIGGILKVNGIEGFLDNRNELYEASDVETAAWRAFTAAWFEKFEDDEVGTSDLYPLVSSGDIPIDLGRGATERSQKTKLGMSIAAHRDRRYGNLTIVTGGTRKRAQMFRLIKGGD